LGNTLSNTPAIVATLVLLGALGANTGGDPRRLLSGRNVVLVGIASWFLFEALTLPEALTVYTSGEYTLGVAAVVASMLAFLLGYHGSGGCAAFPQFGRTVRRLDDPELLWRLVLTGAVVGFAPIIYFTGTDLITNFDSLLGMRSTWGGVLARGRYGDARAAFLMLEMFATGVAPFAAILLFARRTPFNRRLVCLALVCWPMIRAFGVGTRSSLVTAVMPVLMVLYFKLRPGTQRKIVIAGLLCAPLVYQLMAAIVISRGEGEFSWENHKKAEYVGNEMFRELLFIQRRVPQQLDYQYGYVYYVQIVNPIPRFLWPEKPTLDTGLLMADLYGDVDQSTGEANLTVSPGLIGEMYLNFGWFGVVGLSALGGWLVRGWDRIAEEHADSLAALIYYVGGLAVLFIMGRSFTMNMFYGLMSFTLLVWVLQHLAPTATPSAAPPEAPR
jgi:oligosaccharide repeat unit polymerase